MSEEQKIEMIRIDELVSKAEQMSQNGFRLVQIGCTKTDGYEMNYSFDRNFEFINLRILLPDKESELPSITKVYWSAFLYENEIKDLFGLNIKDIAVDYKGNFYKTTVKIPFSC